MVAKWSQEEQEGQIAPIIVTILIKAGASFLADFGLQTICAYYFDESCENDWTKAMGEVNWIQVGRSTIEGAIPWKIPGGVLGKAAVTAAGDIIVNFTSSLINPETYTLKDLGVDFMIGFIGQLAGDGISELILKYGESGIKNGLKKLGFNDAFFDKLKVSKISAELLQLKEEALAKFGKNVIQDLDGAYIDNIEDIVIKNGLTMDQFELLIRRPVPGVTIDKTLFPDIVPLSEAEATIIRNIRYELIGTLDENTIFEKVITETDATSYMNNNYRFGNTVGGFVSRAQDVKHLNTPEANFYGIRLDYQSSEFLSPDNAGYVIRFTTKEHNKLNIPNINEFPNTGHGFTAGINGYLGIPELQTTGGMELETASIFLIREDGTEELVGILTKDIRTDIKTFKSVN